MLLIPFAVAFLLGVSLTLSAVGTLHKNLALWLAATVAAELLLILLLGQALTTGVSMGGKLLSMAAFVIVVVNLAQAGKRVFTKPVDANDSLFTSF